MDLKVSVLALTVCLYTVLQDQLCSSSTVPGTTVTDTSSTTTLSARGSTTVSSTNKGSDKHTTPITKAATSTYALTTTTSKLLSCFDGTCTGNISCINTTLSSKHCTISPNKGCYVKDDGQKITVGCDCDRPNKTENEKMSCCLSDFCNFQIQLKGKSWITQANSVFHIFITLTATIFTTKQTQL